MQFGVLPGIYRVAIHQKERHLLSADAFLFRAGLQRTVDKFLRLCYSANSAEGMTFAGNVMLDKATD